MTGEEREDLEEPEEAFFACERKWSYSVRSSGMGARAGAAQWESALSRGMGAGAPIRRMRSPSWEDAS